MGDPEHFSVDVGYRDPGEERDDWPDDRELDEQGAEGKRARLAVWPWWMGNGPYDDGTGRV